MQTATSPLQSATPPREPLISVIIPVFNTARFLPQCLQSVLNQTHANLEIICVNDGSTDDSGDILARFAAADSRITLIVQENLGYGAALNRALARVRGEFVGIVESDDFIAPQMYERLVVAAQASGADVVKCNFYKHNSYATPPSEVWRTTTQDITTAPDAPFNPVRDYPQIFFFHASVWANLYRAEFVRRFAFDESSGAAYQDFAFAMGVLGAAQTMAVVKEPLYFYRCEHAQDNSSQAGVNDGAGAAKFLKMADASAAACEILLNSNLLATLKEEFFYHVAIANYPFYEQQTGENLRLYASKLREIFAKFHSSEFRYFDDKRLKNWVVQLQSGKTPRVSFASWRRRFLRFKIKNGTLFVKFGRFEKLMTFGKCKYFLNER